MNHYPAYQNGTLDPDARALLDQLAASGSRPLWSMPPTLAR